MYNQMYAYLNKILSKWQYRFRQGYSIEHCLLIMTEKWCQYLDKEGEGGGGRERLSEALLTDFSKAFDCLLHDLLIAKLAAYGFDYDSLVFIKTYLSERQQRTKVSNPYSTYFDILHGVPQGSILGPLLFNIYISDKFYDMNKCDIASYADDNTLYINDFNLEEVIQKLESTTNNLFEWFNNNHMKDNADKCHLLVTKDTDVTAKIGEFDVKNSREEKLLGVKIDSKTSFENVSFLCKKASQKLHALARVVNFMDLAKRKSLMKSFITDQFNYCLLIWMFHSRQLNSRINKIQERALRLVHQDNKLTFDDLLKVDNSVTIHQRNLQILATEIFKVKTSLAPEIMTEVFEIKEPHYNFRSEASHFKRENVKSTHYGIQSVQYL